MLDYTNEFSFVLKPSSIQNGGIGVFATHAIKSGTKLMLNKEGGESRMVDPDYIPEALKHFCIVLQNGKLKAPREFNHLWIVWYLNHSKYPNAELNQQENNYFAIKDIQEGEEILINYNAFNEPAGAKQDFYG